MNDQNPSVKLMIQSGLIPENALQQLVNWRLLPETSVESSGSRPISMEKEWDDVESFVYELRTALDEEAKTIRETELDQVGEYRNVAVRIPSDTEAGVDWASETLDVFVDRLGRVLLPPKKKFEQAISVTFLDDENGGESTLKKVVQVENRFKGQKLAAYVIYLEK